MRNYLKTLVIGAALALGGCVSDKTNIPPESAQPKVEQHENFTLDTRINDELRDGETDILKEGTRIGIREIFLEPRSEDFEPAGMVFYHFVEDGTVYQVGNPRMVFDALMDTKRTLDVEIMMMQQGLSSFKTRKAYLQSVDTNKNLIIDGEEVFKVYKDNKSNPEWKKIYESLHTRVDPIVPDTSIVKPNNEESLTPDWDKVYQSLPVLEPFDRSISNLKPDNGDDAEYDLILDDKIYEPLEYKGHIDPKTSTVKPN